MVNSFEYRLIIDDVPYTIAVDATQGDRKRIVVNTKVVFDADCASWMKPRTDIMYIPFYIRNKYIVISIDDRELTLKYNIYIDKVSPIDGSNLYDDYNKALETVKGGLWQFIKVNWEIVLLKLILSGIGYGSVSLIYMHRQLTMEQRVFTVLFFVALLPVFVLWEWWFNLRTVKKFKNRFRTSDVVRVK